MPILGDVIRKVLTVRVPEPSPAIGASRTQPVPPRDPGTVTPHQPGSFNSPSTSMEILGCIADALQRPPATVSQNYVDRVSFVASYLSVPVSRTQPAPPPGGNSIGSIVQAATQNPGNIPQTGITNPWWNSILPRLWTGDEHGQSVASAAQANILAFVERVRLFADQARNAGFKPPDNPFLVVVQINQARTGLFSPISNIISAQTADDLLFNIKVYVDLLQAQNQGAIDLQQGTINASQLSHIRLSFDGLGGSGNAAADLLRFLPSTDQVKQEVARQALSVLDFKKRIPYLLFTLDYSPIVDGPTQGTVIGWKKIPDVSGYIIKRRAVFSGEEIQWEVDNDLVKSQTDSLMSYAQTFALSFFDALDEKSIQMFIDQAVQPDEIYIYRIQGYQVRNNQKGAVFTIDSRPVSLTITVRQQIDQTIRQQSNWPDFTITGYGSDGQPIKVYNNFVETISPWPAVAQVLFGDSTYDWLLAAVNIRASINRLDDRTMTRKYSYLNAHSQFLFDQADAGKLVMPLDVNQIVKNVNDSIQKFGVNQTIQNLLDETGISYYFEGRDAPEDTHFDRVGSDSVRTSNLFRLIAAAIDPETATLDLKSLASNMAQLLDQGLVGVDTRLQPGERSSTNAQPTEVAVPFPENSTAARATSGLQFIDKLGDLRDAVIDLTTFEGLSKFMRTIRILSDFGPDRVPPNPPPADVPPPPPPPPPPPATDLTTESGVASFESLAA